ncbi:MAG: TonB-dependent siderophore receptor [Steroidobacteraceae bacterium]
MFWFFVGSPLWIPPAVLAGNEAPPRIDIEPGSLQRALQQLADLTQLQILYDPGLVRGLASQGVKGARTPSEALKELLTSTGITFEFTADDAVALHTAARSNFAGSSDYTGSSRPKTITINADRTAQGRYSSDGTVSGLKVDGPSLLVPVTTQSLTQQVLRDQQVTRLEDMLEYVSGTEIVPDGQAAPGFAMRGFPTYQYYVDGVRSSPDVHHDGPRDLANIDHAEIVKGPASLLYGRMEPGGLVNLVIKQPLSTPLLSLEQQVSSFERQRTQLDTGGPLSSGGALLYRFNAAWERGHSFREISGYRRIFLAPAVTWKFSAATEESAYLEYLDSHDPSDSGLPVVGNRLPSTPMERSLDEGGEVHTNDLRFGLRGRHTFADGWVLRHHLEARRLRAPQSPQIALAADGLDPASCSVNSCPVNRALVSVLDASGETEYGSMDLTRDFSVWRTRHSFLTGLEAFQSLEKSILLSRSDPSLATDLFAPPLNMTIPTSLLDNPDWSSNLRTREFWAGAYIQYQVSLADRLYLLSGWRFDNVWNNIRLGVNASKNNILIPDGSQANRLRSLKQREGILWHLAEPLSIYLSYAENFGAAPGLYVSADASTGLMVGEQTAHEWEGGLKLEAAGGRASATVTWFDLTKQDITLPLLEPALNQSGVLFPTGNARNHGLEFDFRGEIASNLQLTASYAYIQSRIRNAERRFPAGFNGYELIGRNRNQLFGVPHHGGSLWGTYLFTHGSFSGLKLGAGAVIRGVREGDNINDYQLPGFTRINTMAAYTWYTADTRMSVQLNVDNLFDKRYFESLSGTRTVMPGSPRHWIASWRVEF